MPFRPSRILLPLCLLATIWGSLSGAAADEPAPSLYERRLDILKGKTKGIVLYEPAKAEATAAAPSSNSNGKMQASADTKLVSPAQQAPAQQPSAAAGFLSGLPAPSGRSMADARRLGAVGGGIPLPTGNKATQETPAAPANKQ